jgi:hydroxypyruvate isomerase
MSEKVETPNTQLQKVTLLVAMHDHEPDDLNAGEWLLNVLMACAERKDTAYFGAKEYAKVMQVLAVEDCKVVLSNGSQHE